jgi:hypothetical protein
MDVYQLLDIAVSLSNRLDTHWTLFITVHMALIGGIIYVDRPLQKSEKIGAIFVYSGFALVNFLMMLNQANFLSGTYIDILAMKDQPCCVDSATVAHVVRMAEYGDFKTTIGSIALIHIAMYIVVLTSIMRDKARVDTSVVKNSGDMVSTASSQKME